MNGVFFGKVILYIVGFVILYIFEIIVGIYSFFIFLFFNLKYIVVIIVVCVKDGINVFINIVLNFIVIRFDIVIGINF